jgi:hypothetical protein
MGDELDTLNVRKACEGEEIVPAPQAARYVLYRLSPQITTSSGPRPFTYPTAPEEHDDI